MPGLRGRGGRKDEGERRGRGNGNEGWGETGGGVGVVKTLVSRPGIRVSRHNAGALIERARGTEGNAFVF